jgi:ketosteroid isomerase-like protein
MPMRLPLLLVALVFTAGCAAPVSSSSGRVADEKFIVDGERAWADADAAGDPATVERLIADDYRGITPDGTPIDKQGEVDAARHGAGTILSHEVHAVQVRFYGDTAVAQGSESWQKKDGEPRRGRYVWTDTWVRRDGRWQVVAAEDITLPEPAPSP